MKSAGYHWWNDEVTSKQSVDSPGEQWRRGRVLWAKIGKASEYLSRFRSNRKEIIIESLGGACVCCGYNACRTALCCHHIDPTTKLFSPAKKQNASWERLPSELRKCVLLCSNCHFEVHSGLREIPSDARRFDETFQTIDRRNHCGG